MKLFLMETFCPKKAPEVVFISRLVSTREFPGFSTILNFSFLVSISRLVSFLEISGKIDVFWHENVKS